MSRRGVWQLRNIVLYYCKHGGSSRGVREFIENGGVELFASKNPQLSIKTEECNGRHPHVLGEYVHGRKIPIDLRNCTVQEIEEKLQYLRNQWGLRARPISKRQWTSNPSIQGYWHPFLFADWKPLGPAAISSAAAVNRRRPIAFSNPEPSGKLKEILTKESVEDYIKFTTAYNTKAQDVTAGSEPLLPPSEYGVPDSELPKKKEKHRRPRAKTQTTTPPPSPAQ